MRDSPVATANLLKSFGASKFVGSGVACVIATSEPMGTIPSCANDISHARW